MAFVSCFSSQIFQICKCLKIFYRNCQTEGHNFFLFFTNIYWFLGWFFVWFGFFQFKCLCVVVASMVNKDWSVPLCVVFCLVHLSPLPYTPALWVMCHWVLLLSTEGFASLLPSTLKDCMALSTHLREKQGIQVTTHLGRDVHSEGFKYWKTNFT